MAGDERKRFRDEEIRLVQQLKRLCLEESPFSRYAAPAIPSSSRRPFTTGGIETDTIATDHMRGRRIDDDMMDDEIYYKVDDDTSYFHDHSAAERDFFNCSNTASDTDDININVNHTNHNNNSTARRIFVGTLTAGCTGGSTSERPSSGTSSRENDHDSELESGDNVDWLSHMTHVPLYQDEDGDVAHGFFEEVPTRHEKYGAHSLAIVPWVPEPEACLRQRNDLLALPLRELRQLAATLPIPLQRRRGILEKTDLVDIVMEEHRR